MEMSVTHTNVEWRDTRYFFIYWSKRRWCVQDDWSESWK